MQMRVDEISTSPKTITIRGDEAWLQQIILGLQDSDTTPPTTIRGEITVRRDSAGFIYGSGHVTHTPLLSCSRCAMDIPWPISAEINVTWRPPFESHTPREMTLSAEDLDVYFIEAGKIDFEQLINDVLQCALPDRVIVQKEGSDDCGICHKSLNDDLVYGKRDEAEPSSPFAVLKNLKG